MRIMYTGSPWRTIWGPDGRRYQPQDETILDTLAGYYFEGPNYTQAFHVAIMAGRLVEVPSLKGEL